MSSAIAHVEKTRIVAGRTASAWPAIFTDAMVQRIGVDHSMPAGDDGAEFV
jgi:hypothetical protein